MSFQEKGKHVNSYLHEILNYLKNATKPVSFRDIYLKLKIDIHNNPRLITALQKNEKILIENNALKYLYTYDIKSREDLISVLRASKTGIELSKLQDNQVDITSFLEECKNLKICIVLKDIDNSEVVFYNDTLVDPIDSSIVDLWRSIKVPSYQDLIRDLNSVGLKTNQVETVKKKILTKKPKTRRQRRNIKITNTHVKGLDLRGMDDEY